MSVTYMNLFKPHCSDDDGDDDDISNHVRVPTPSKRQIQVVFKVVRGANPSTSRPQDNSLRYA